MMARDLFALKLLESAVEVAAVGSILFFFWVIVVDFAEGI